METLNTAYFDKLSQPFVERQDEIDLYILLKLAKRIKEIGELSPLNLNSFEQFLKTSENLEEIQRELDKLYKQQHDEIRSIITLAAEESYLQCEPMFKHRKVDFLPFMLNDDLQDILMAYIIALQTLYTEMENGVGYYMTDKITGNKALMSVADTYIYTANSAIQAKRTSTLDYNLVMRPYIDELLTSKLRVDTSDNDTPQIRTFSGVASNLILNGIRDVIVAVQNEVGRILHADGKEIIAHINSAPDHEPSQGHQFTNEQFERIQSGQDFEDLQGRKYIGFPRAIGTWNCRHIVKSILCGVTKQQLSDEALEEIKAKNAKGYTFPDGRHLTMYECTQQQRRMENNIRKYKNECLVAKAVGDTAFANKFRAKAYKERVKYLTFSKNCGLKPKRSKIRLIGL